MHRFLPLLLTTLSCTTIPSSGELPTPRSPGPGTHAPTDTVPDTAASPAIRFTYRPGTHQYLVVTDAAITLGGDTSSQRNRSETATRAYYTLNISPQGEVYSGSLDSVRIRRQGSIPAPKDSFTQLPLHWSEQNTPVDMCSPAAEFARSGIDILPNIPRELHRGDRWTDTTTTYICRNGLPLMLTATHDYEAVGLSTFQGDSAYHILRHTNITITSPAVTDSTMPAFQLTGGGTGTSDIYLDIDNRELIGRSTEGKLTLTLDGSRGLTELRQDLRAQVSRLNHAP